MSEECPAPGKGGSGVPARHAFPRLYEELRQLAGQYLQRERTGHSLQPTALVNEAFVRMANDRGCAWRTESGFIGIAATVMRQVLVDHARKHNAAKRGGGVPNLSIDTSGSNLGTAEREAVDVLALDEALGRLKDLHPRQARLVELRVFGGLSVTAAAELAGVAPSTAHKDWEMARAWLLRHLGG